MRFWPFYILQLLQFSLCVGKKNKVFFLLTPEDVADGNINVAAVQQLDHMEDVGVSPRRRRIPYIYPQVLCSSL